MEYNKFLRKNYIAIYIARKRKRQSISVMISAQLLTLTMSATTGPGKSYFPRVRGARAKWVSTWRRASERVGDAISCGLRFTIDANLKTTVKHRGKELLTTEFRCFANYPRLIQSHCSSIADFHSFCLFSPFPPPFRRFLRAFYSSYPSLSLNPFCSPSSSSGSVVSALSSLNRQPYPCRSLSVTVCIALRHEKRSLVKDLSRTATPVLKILSIRPPLKQVWLARLSIAPLDLPRQRNENGD